VFFINGKPNRWSRIDTHAGSIDKVLYSLAIADIQYIGSPDNIHFDEVGVSSAGKMRGEMEYSIGTIQGNSPADIVVVSDIAHIYS